MPKLDYSERLFPLLAFNLSIVLHSSDEIQARKEDDRHGHTLCSSGYYSFTGLCCDLCDHKRDHKEYKKITAGYQIWRLFWLDDGKQPLSQSRHSFFYIYYTPPKAICQALLLTNKICLSIDTIFIITHFVIVCQPLEKLCGMVYNSIRNIRKGW